MQPMLRGTGEGTPELKQTKPVSGVWGELRAPAILLFFCSYICMFVGWEGGSGITSMVGHMPYCCTCTHVYVYVGVGGGGYYK